MNRHFTISLCVASLAFAGCARQVRPILQPSPELAYPTWKFIGYRSPTETECPKLDGWEVQPLFVDDEAIAKAKKKPKAQAVEKAQKVLDRYCVYRTKKQLKIPDTVKGLDSLSSDAVVVSVAGVPTLDETLHHRFASYFFDQVGRSGTTLPIATASNQAKVRLAFLDSYPTGKGFARQSSSCLKKPSSSCRKNPSHSGHGDFLRFLGRAMTCDQGDCMTDVRTRLALPIRKFDRESLEATEIDPECGGFVGSFADLAQAIHAEVDAWQYENEKPPPLVINLSLGWDGKEYGGLESDCTMMKDGPRAVYHALEYAQAHGALVFAAAGNDRSGPNPQTGPLLPAAWETGEPACGAVRTRPLVYAVGGLHADEEPLSNAKRPGSMPRLAAYGDHAALGSFGPSWPTGTYTGTSVSTAVVSSIAAAVWYQHQQPELSPEAVFERLYTSGKPLGDRPADFWFRPNAARSKQPEVKRISLCQALAATGSVDSCCTDPSPRRLRLSDLLADNENLIEELQLEPARGPCNVSFHHRREGKGHKNHGKAVELCASDYPDIASFPFLYPQPGHNPCPSCSDPPLETRSKTGEPDHVLHGEIRSDWNDAIDGTLQSATFSVEGEPRTILVDGPFRRGQRFKIPLPPTFIIPESPARTPHATITWVVLLDGRTYSILTPVFIAD